MNGEYKKNTISIDDDPDKAAEEQAKYIAQQSPINRIKKTVQLILRVYSLQPKKENTNKIYIDKE